MKSSRIIKNIVILIIAPFIAVGLLFLVNNLSGLTASVLDIGEIQKVKDEGWDLAYKTEGGIFEIFGSEKVQTAESVNVRILYNPENIELDIGVASGANYEIISENDGSIEIQLVDIKNRDYKEGWFEVPYSGDMTQILLGDSRKEDKKGNKTTLSVGNLNSFEEHSVLP